MVMVMVMTGVLCYSVRVVLRVGVLALNKFIFFAGAEREVSLVVRIELDHFGCRHLSNYGAPAAVRRMLTGGLLIIVLIFNFRFVVRQSV